MRPTTRHLLTAAALAASWPLAAQTAGGQAPEPDGYRSAFEGYRSFEAGEVRDWRQSNDTVREIGGWRAYAREIQAAREAALPRPGGEAGQAPVAPADPHQGHRR